MDKTASEVEVQKPHGNDERKCGRQMRGKISLLPGEVSQAQEKNCVVTTNCEKSAEAIVPGGEKTSGKG